MKKNILPILALTFSVPALAECLDQSSLSKLKADQLEYFQTKFPPAFKHAYEDGKVKLDYKTTNAGSADACIADLQVTFPQEDLDVSNTLLDKEPAKKIMLSAQGYALPETNTLHATFNVDSRYQQLPSQAYLQTKPLGQLTAQLELMYAFVTQARVEAITPNDQSKPWDSQQINVAESKCQALASTIPVDCSCRIEKLSQEIGFRDFEYIDSIQTNPYAFATGAGTSVKNIIAPTNQACAKR